MELKLPTKLAVTEFTPSSCWVPLQPQVGRCHQPLYGFVFPPHNADHCPINGILSNMA